MRRFLFQGFSGDVRRKLISNNAFYRGSLDEMIAAGKALAHRIADVKKQPCSPEKKVQLCVAEALLPLEYTNIPNEPDIPLSLYEEWKQKKEQHDVEQLRFCYIRISENLALLLANAENDTRIREIFEKPRPPSAACRIFQRHGRLYRHKGTIGTRRL